MLSDAGAVAVIVGHSERRILAAKIFAIGNVDGGLVGSASLKPVDFAAIIAAAG